MNEPEPYWYLASYPKSGNTWCRVFITELRRLAGLDTEETTAAAEAEERELRLNRDLATGSIWSSRYWLDDQLGIDSADLRWSELDKVRGRVGHQRARSQPGFGWPAGGAHRGVPGGGGGDPQSGGCGGVAVPFLLVGSGALREVSAR